MKVELIPLVEIKGSKQLNIFPPEQQPYWHYPDKWNKYYAMNLLLSGFTDLGEPYLPGSSFYRLSNVSETNIIKLVKNKLEGFMNNSYDLDDVCPLSGGCVLKVDDTDIFFPQCCGDLSDITYWENIAGKHESEYNPGHPQPVLNINDHTVLFNFETDEFDEPFIPPPAVKQIGIDKNALHQAVLKAKAELQHLAGKLIRINETTDLNIPGIDNLLIWDK